jgi:hypothetical protein
MAFMFHRGLVIPLWAVAVCAVALSTVPRTPFVIGLLGIVVAACTMPAIFRWLRPSRPSVALLPAVDQDPVRPPGITLTGGTRTRTLEEAIDARIQKAEDAAGLVRMDDDGGSRPVPGPVL